MKTIEEKARAYDEALERAKKCLDEKRDTCFVRPDVIFPELKESEDERVRKHLISLVKNWDKDGIVPKYTSNPNDIKQILAWLDKLEVFAEHGYGLYYFASNGFAYVGNTTCDNVLWFEKQGEKPKFRIGDIIKKKSTGAIVTISEIDLKNGEYRLSNTGFIPFKYEYLWELVEQKSADKVEPKFHKGDWIVENDNGTVSQIIGVINGIDEYGEYHAYEHTNGYFHACFENNYHLWTIEDAKDGDVLVGSDDSLFILAKVKDNSAYYYFSLCTNGSKEISDGTHAWETANGCHPATKEQRDLLFQKMKEAGYEFDFEKKELKEIKSKFKVGDWLTENHPNNYARFVQILEIVNVQGKNRYRISRDLHNDEDIVECQFIEDNWHRFNIEDAKYGDVLVDEDNNIGIFEKCVGICWHSHIYLGCDCELRFFGIGGSHKQTNTHPATKEQRDALMKAMAEAGYEWDAEKKELKKIHVIDEGKAEMDYCFTKMMNGEKVSCSEEDEEYDGEDYGIDGLYHAQRILEKTLGKVDGYQTDDGILEHQCAITAVKKKYMNRNLLIKLNQNSMRVIGLYLITIFAKL